jgi:hypothetical protein
MIIPVSDDAGTYIVGHLHFERLPNVTIGCKSLGLTCAKDPLKMSKDSGNVCNHHPLSCWATTRNNLSAFFGQGSQTIIYGCGLFFY